MKAITFFGGAYSGANQLAGKIASVLGCKLIRDDELIERVADEYGFNITDVGKSVYGNPPVPAQYSAVAAGCIAGLKAVMADEMKKGACVFSGLLGELIPRELALHVLVTASSDYRSRRIFRVHGLTPDEASGRIHTADQQLFQWSDYLEKMEGWSAGDSHAVVASDHMEVSSVIDEITQAIEAKGMGGARAEEAVEDFVMAARVSAVMAEKRIPVAVSVRDACAELTVVKPVLMLARHEKKLMKIASAIPGVKKVETRVGPQFYRADIITKLEFVLSPARAMKSIERKYTAIQTEVAEYQTPLMKEAEDNRISQRL